MVTARKIRCMVVVATAETDVMPQRHQPRFRPSDLLPWADPHIRSLVEQLQDEVREEASQRQQAEPSGLAASGFSLPEGDLLAAPGARRF